MLNEDERAPETAGNEDLEFDRNNTSTTDTQPVTDNEESKEADTLDQQKVEELATNDFPPLSEVEKKPKLQDDDRIEEMNRKTSIGD